jgi:beta-lactam-binding protein with PASTA domain
VTYRDGQTELDNGRCRDVSMLVYFTGHAPPKTANCRPNEVEVPDVVGWRLGAARVRLQGQPLTPQLVYKPAKAGQRVDVVLRQFPRTGRLSSFDKVTLVLGKPLHGTVPDVVGLRLARARAGLGKLKLLPVLRFGAGKPGRVIAQKPRAGVAAAPGMKIRLTIGGAG